MAGLRRAEALHGKLRSVKYLLGKDGRARQIRRAETMDDLFATVNWDSRWGERRREGSPPAAAHRPTATKGGQRRRVRPPAHA